MNLDNLRDVFHEQLKDMYSAEKQLSEALPKLVQAASASELKQAFEAKGYEDLKFVVIEAKDSDQDPRVLEIHYPNVIAPDSAYISPRVQMRV